MGVRRDECFASVICEDSVETCVRETFSNRQSLARRDVTRKEAREIRPGHLGCVADEIIRCPLLAGKSVKRVIVSPRRSSRAFALKFPFGSWYPNRKKRRHRRCRCLDD